MTVPLRRRPIDPNRFRAIMCSLPAGVAVVTTVDEHDQPKGLTSTAVCSVSAEPPLLLVCVGCDSRTLPALLARGRFAVNLLEASCATLSSRFASKSEEKFAGVPWRPSDTGLPILDDAIGWAEGAIVEQIAGGDHVILLARVEAGEPGRPVADPLVYYNRAYGRWTSLDGSPARNPASTTSIS